MNNILQYVFLIIIFLFVIHKTLKTTYEGFTSLNNYRLIAPVETMPLELIQTVPESECSQLSTTIEQNNMIQSRNGVAMSECCSNENCYFHEDPNGPGQCKPVTKQYLLNSITMVGAMDAWSPSCFVSDIDDDTDYDTCIETTVRQGIRAYYFTVDYDALNTNNDLKCYVTDSFKEKKHSNILLQDVLISLINNAFSSMSCKNSDDMLVVYLNFKKPYPSSNFIPFKLDDVLKNSGSIVTVRDTPIIKTKLTKLLTTSTKIIFLSNIDTTSVYDNNDNVIHNLNTIGIKDPQKYERTLNSNNFSIVTHNKPYTQENITKHKIKGLFFGKVRLFDNSEASYLQRLYGNISGKSYTSSFVVDKTDMDDKYHEKEPLGCYSAVVNNFTITNQRLGTTTTHSSKT
jgi:hypothetical protein